MGINPSIYVCGCAIIPSRSTFPDAGHTAAWIDVSPSIAGCHAMADYGAPLITDAKAGDIALADSKATASDKAPLVAHAMAGDRARLVCQATATASSDAPLFARQWRAKKLHSSPMQRQAYKDTWAVGIKPTFLFPKLWMECVDGGRWLWCCRVVSVRRPYSGAGPESESL